MAFSEIEHRRVDKAVGAYVESRRPPPHIRPELDISYRIKNQSIELFEVRPAWKDPDTTLEHAIAKATYVKRQRIWKVYWMRQDLKWHRYEPDPEAKTVEDFLAIVERDEYGCFYG